MIKSQAGGSSDAQQRRDRYRYLGDMAAHARRHLDGGRYASMSELVRAGLRALDREEAALDAILRARVVEALTDSRPSVPLADGMAMVRTTTSPQAV